MTGNTSSSPASGPADSDSRAGTSTGLEAALAHCDIIEQWSTAVIVIGSDLRIARWNRQAAEIFQLPAAKAIGRPWSQILDFFAQLGIDKHMKHAMESGQTISMVEMPINLEKAIAGDDLDSWDEWEDSTQVRNAAGRLMLPGRAADGTPLEYFDIVIDPLQTPDGEPLGLSLTIRRTTERALLRLNLGLKTEVLEMIYQVSNTLRAVRPMESELFIVLSALTARQGGAFDRGLLFRVDPECSVAQGWMGIGSMELADVWSLWRRLAEDDAQLSDVLAEMAPAVLAQMSETTDRLRKLEFGLDSRGAIAEAVRSRTTLHEGNLPDGCKLERELAAEFDIGHYYVVPMVSRGEANGLLVLDYTNTPPALSPDQVGLLEMYAHQAALAIENTRAYERAVREAQTDALTGLANHGHFQTTLAQALRQAKRYDHKVSLIMLDIDWFKRLNDTWGHPAGDQVLRTLGRVLEDATRDVDLCARYGGEEFAIVLPHTPLAEAETLAHRLAERVREQVYYRTPDGETVPTTASLGVACFPDDAGDPQALIAAADAALYRAKEGGRNRVESRLLRRDDVERRGG